MTNKVRTFGTRKVSRPVGEVPKKAGLVSRDPAKAFSGTKSAMKMEAGFAGHIVQVRKAKVRSIDQSAYEPDARSRAILEGVRITQKDLEDAGGAFDLEQVRTLLRGITRQAIDKRVQEGSLLAVPGPSNHRAFPTLQFNRDGSIVAGLKEVRAALPVESPWAVLNFLANPDDRLAGRRPIDVLRAGEVAQAIEAARLYGEPGG